MIKANLYRLQFWIIRNDLKVKIITISISVCAADILSLYPCIISFTPYGLVYIHTVYVLCIVYRLRYIRNVEMLYKGCWKKTTSHFFLLIINIIMKFISQCLLYRMVGLHGSKIYKIWSTLLFISWEPSFT